MKPIIHLISFFVSIFIFSTSHAQTSRPLNTSFNAQLSDSPSEPLFHVEFATDQNPSIKLEVWVNNLDKRRCTISISSQEGILWSKEFKDAYYTGIYDLDSLDDGKYIVRVSHGKDEIEKTIDLTSKVYSVRAINMK